VKRNFLIVAANGRVRETLARELRGQGYLVSLAASGAAAERIVQSVTVDVVLVESHLPDMSADQLRDNVVKARPDCRVVMLSSYELVRNTPDQLRLNDDDFLLKSDEVIRLLRSRDAGSEVVTNQRAVAALIEVIDVIVGLIEVDDRFFGGSSHRVMKLAQAVAQELAVDQEMLNELMIATLLRDLGKVNLDPELLAARETFTEEQKQKMKEHVDSSVRLFEHVDFPWKVSSIVRHHHERYDGEGFPEGLRGREIPVGARIVAVVDSFVALTSDRQHREALDPESALQEMILQAGHQFDPEVVEAFQRVLDRRFGKRRPKKKPRVLILEPQTDFRSLLKMRLLNEEFEVREANDPDQALKIILENPTDLVLADADTHPLEVFSLLQEMREDEALRRVAFIFLSRRSDRVLKMRALREGVDDFLSKDMDTEEIVAHVSNVIRREAIRHGMPRKARRGITGDLENLSLPDMIQTLVVGMKTASIKLKSGRDKGQIWFENGTPLHAEMGRARGEDAFFKMLRWNCGEFVIEHGITTKSTTIQNDAMFLLMEGLRILDEETAEAVS
jgi:response regulator RpfG family c-di-GMP phosphodiesterase